MSQNAEYERIATVFRQWSAAENRHEKTRAAQGLPTSGCVHMQAAYNRCADYIEAHIDSSEVEG